MLSKNFKAINHNGLATIPIVQIDDYNVPH
jgi:hypothetical protein